MPDGEGTRQGHGQLTLYNLVEIDDPTQHSSSPSEKSNMPTPPAEHTLYQQEMDIYKKSPTNKKNFLK